MLPHVFVMEHADSREAGAAEFLLTQMLAAGEIRESVLDGELPDGRIRAGQILFAKASGDAQVLPENSLACLELSHWLWPDARVKSRLAHDLLAGVETRPEDISRVRQLAAEAAEMEAGYWLSWYVLGLAAEDTGQARKFLEKALPLAPNWAQNLCRVKLEEMDHE